MGSTLQSMLKVRGYIKKQVDNATVNKEWMPPIQKQVKKMNNKQTIQFLTEKLKKLENKKQSCVDSQDHSSKLILIKC